MNMNNPYKELYDDLWKNHKQLCNAVVDVYCLLNKYYFDGCTCDDILEAKEMLEKGLKGKYE